MTVSDLKQANTQHNTHTHLAPKPKRTVKSLIVSCMHWEAIHRSQTRSLVVQSIEMAIQSV